MVGNGKTAACAALVLLLLAAAAAADRAIARDRPTDCKVGPLKSTSELDDRIAACTILIDSSRSAAKLVLALSYRAQNLLNQKKCDAALADLMRAKDVSPSRKGSAYYDLHLWISYYWQHCKGDFDRGIEVLNEAAAILPRDPAVYNQRANLLSDKGDHAAALADINRSIALINNDPYRASAYNNRALIWKTIGEYEKAAADFGVAIKLAPKNAKYYANRGEAWRRTGNLARALQDQDRAIELYAGGPGVALGLTLRGETLRYMGEYDRALSDFNQAVRIEPDFAPAFTGRGLTFERTGDIERAKSEFRAALSISENSGRGDISKSARETAEARLAALSSGAPQPTILPAPARATSTTSVPTPRVATPVVAPAIVKATAAKQGRRAALIIGNSAYRSVKALDNPHRDAEKVAGALRAIGFDSVTVATDVTREKMTEALRTFAAAADKSDWAMVYYAGHGIEVNGVNYLIPVDAKLASGRDALFEAMPLDQVMAAIDGAKKLKLVMLDACRDNPFANSTTAAQAPVATAPVPASNQDSTRSAKTRSVGRGLGEVKVQGASLVVYAAKHGETALDGEGDYSPFAVAVVQRIATPGVEINKLFRLVRDDVMEATAGRQEPYTYGSLPGREDFFFVNR
ncbi:caspase family protein [Bradyrhizobium sp. LjRoot220]|uniref:caspase family protein n=1 Tax=Bradyrhizobium sp. LjRoot220 TaxID=3342284 RepID=UPI003ECF2533